MNSTTTTITPPNAAAGGSPSAGSYYRFKPWNVGRFVIWTLFAAMLIVAPMLFRSSLALTMLSQIGYLIIICLSYNILLGQGGMLSFGHAVYKTEDPRATHLRRFSQQVGERAGDTKWY